jgi:hypothetical protein
MNALSETCSRPTYTGEFRDLNWERLKPPGIRYQPRQDPLIGMNSTDHPNRWKGETSHAISKEERKKARASRAKVIADKPPTIAVRLMAVLRKAGDWVPTGALIDAINADMPPGAVVATKRNIYEAMAPLRKSGRIESQRIGAASQFMEWRLVK